MRLFGHLAFRNLTASPRGPRLLALAATLALAGWLSPALGQTAPYLLPYTASTYAGPHAEYSGSGVACGSLFTLDTAGDGCLASQVSVGIDPHDVRVDNKGNLFYLDNGSSTGVVHRINPFNQLETIEAGTLSTIKSCTAGDAFGDGCIANDGAANANANTPTSLTHSLYTAGLHASRGLGLGPNGDVLIAGYNDSYDHRIAASTLINNVIQYNYMQAVMGDGSSGSPSTSGPITIATSTVNSTRGVTEDLYGNVYVADTVNYILREESGGIVTNLTSTNSGSGKVFVSGSSAANALLGEPEDVHVDSYGNIYIVDFSNKLLEAIYKGGTLPNVPVTGLNNIYTIAGGATATPSVDTTPVNGIYPTVAANTVGITMRKISLDPLNNVYITDYSNNVIWFLDHATGYMRILAGNYGSSTPHGGCAAPLNSLGDGCPGEQAAFNLASSNSGIGADADGQGNLYITDPEGSGNSAGSRIRKLLSGLNFPATATGTSVNQSLDIHFAPGDTPAASAYTLTASGKDYVLGTAVCTVNADTTDDCILPVTFTPTVAGPDNATLKVTSTAGGAASFVLTGTGTAAAIAFDPGNTANIATINNSQGIALDGAGDAYIADTGSNRILFYNASTSSTTVFAGTGASGNSGNGGLATAATLNAPKAVAIGTDGSIYIADTGNNVIRKVNSAGIITLYAGGGTVCAPVTQYAPGATDAIGDGCAATQATFSSPSGLATDKFGSLYIADTGNNLIRQIGTTGFVTILAGGGSTSTACSAAVDSNNDGCAGLSAIFNAPTGIAYDPIGQNIIVADTGNSIVRKIYLASNITNTAGVATSVVANPVTLIAGNGQAGSSVSASNVATNSQLNDPTGVAIDASGTVYIADTGNDTIRMVTTSGVITTIAGITGASGTGTVPASAIITQLASPGALAVLPGGTLTIADSGNNRLLTDTRSQITYNFGVTNKGTSSPLQNFTETNIGSTTSSATLPSPLFAPSPSDSQLALVAAANGNSSIPACAAGSFASGAICNLQGQFNPTDTNLHSSAFAQAATGISASAPTPTITLQGQGAVQTATTSIVAQTFPATGNAVFGTQLTLTATVSATPNTFDPVAYPSGNVIFIIDGTAGAGVKVAQGTVSLSSTSATANSPTSQTANLSAGTHTISCQYNGDYYYAGSQCLPTNKTITIAQAGTTSLLSATNNNMPQFTPVSLQAQVISTTTGVPTGSVNFFATLSGSSTATPIGSANVNAAGIATLQLYETSDSNGNLTFNTTLLPGTYSLTCQYTGGANYTASSCAGINFTVTPQPQAFTLAPKGCVPSSLAPQGSFTAVLSQSCTYAQVYVASPITVGQLNTSTNVITNVTYSGIVSGSAPLYVVDANTNKSVLISNTIDVAVAQGATTDLTLFITPTNTVNGTLTFACSGLPANSVCTFSPTTIPLTASTSFATPVYVDVTIWNDLQPVTAAQMHAPTLGRGKRGVALAGLIGWPLLLIGMACLLRKRRRFTGVAWIALLMVLSGAALTLNGCAGPGDYVPNLTTAGNYPVTITVSGPNGLTQSVVIEDTVTAPGLPGQE